MQNIGCRISNQATSTTIKTKSNKEVVLFSISTLTALQLYRPVAEVDFKQGASLRASLPFPTNKNKTPDDCNPFIHVPPLLPEILDSPRSSSGPYSWNL
jgi:hypothetical protein